MPEAKYTIHRYMYDDMCLRQLADRARWIHENTSAKFAWEAELAEVLVKMGEIRARMAVYEEKAGRTLPK